MADQDSRAIDGAGAAPGGAPAAERRQAVLIGLDWGTSSLRALLFDDSGRVLDARALPWGIMRLPEPAPAQAGRVHAGYEQAFADACGDWLAQWPRTPVLACGMVGSAQGWCEAAYAGVPADPAGLAERLAEVRSHDGVTIRIIPGMIERGDQPNVMRGEETQVFGVIGGEDAPVAGAACLVGLPGTHSKWVRVGGGQVLGFDTFMTGEVYSALCGHTILGRTMTPAAAPDDQAFLRGVRQTRAAEARLGMLSTIFSTRTLGLTGALAPASQADYLSGLLIGHELAALADCRAEALGAAQPVLVGSEELCRRYALAFEALGLPLPRRAAQATERGLWRIAVAAGLVTPRHAT